MYNIIIVDDEPAILESFSDSVHWTDYGFELTGSFSNAMDAYDFLYENQVDVIFSDIRMPKMDGLQFAKLVGENYPNIMFVLLSAYKDFEYAKEAIKHGVFEYILKPFEYIELENLLKRLSKNLVDNELRKNDFLIQEYQHVLCGFYNGIVSKEDLNYFLKKNKLNFSVESSHVAILSVHLPDIINYLKTVWVYGLERLYNCLLRFLSGDSISFIPLNYSFNTMHIIAISNQPGDWKFEDKLNNIIELFIKTSEEELLIRPNITVAEFFSSLIEAGELIKSTINQPYDLTDSCDSSDAVMLAKTFIDNNFVKEISLATVSEYVGFSSCYFSRLFKKVTGENFSEYITKKKLKEAKKLLASNTYTITQVAQTVGYNNINYFHRTFKKHFKMTPQDYKTMQKEG